jgi:uncharacterized membrane protein YphA (DoxX/SURF4 family)
MGTKLQACGLAVLRVAVGIVYFVHGYQKLFQFGFHGVAGMFGHMGIPLPAVSAVIVTLVEFVGGILLITGLATRIPAALNAVDMTVAILAVHLKNGFSGTDGLRTSAHTARSLHLPCAGWRGHVVVKALLDSSRRSLSWRSRHAGLNWPPIRPLGQSDSL